MTKAAKRTFWAVTLDAGDDPIERWKHCKAWRRAEYLASSAAFGVGSDALGEADDGDQIDVIVAEDKRGTNARRFTVTLSIDIHYSVDGDEPIDLNPPPTDANGNVIKGLADDSTIPLFGDATLGK